MSKIPILEDLPPADGACCAHLKVLYTTEDLPDGSTRGWWQCWDCRARFVPVALAEFQQRKLSNENYTLRLAVRNQCADNLCWFDDPEIGKALPEPQFLESCRRYRAQIAGEVGELSPGTMTIAQLEAMVLALTIDRDVAIACAKADEHKMSCGHQEYYAYSEDGGKFIQCLVCAMHERDRLRDALDRHTS